MRSGENHENSTATEEASELQQLREELQRQNEMYLRAMADFENYRRRVARDRESEVRRGRQRLMLSLLDVMDEFERAMAHMGDAPEPVRKGVEAIQRKLQAVLEAQGATAISSEGAPFSPAEHEAIGSVEGDGEPGVVVEEVQRGYRWGDELLRPARVRVRK
jgi:molecular chaperone GrpE